MRRALDSRPVQVVVAAALLACTIFNPCPMPAEAAYLAVDLGALPEGSSRVLRALNDAGEVAGGGRIGGEHRGFLLRRGARLQSLERLPGSDYSVALGINGSGDVVGSANIGNSVRGFRSPRNGRAVDLGTLPGDSGSEAFAINERGDVAGYSTGPGGTRAVVWDRAGAIRALPAPRADEARALGINDAGEAVGTADTGTGPQAVLWKGGAVQDLGRLPGHSSSEALGINNKGEIVGSSGDVDGVRRAVLWSPGAGPQDLGILPGGSSSRALAINDRGEVVGTSETTHGSHAFLWTARDGMRDLNDLLTARGPFVLTQAVAVTPRGVILAIGRDDTGAHAGHGHDHDHHEAPMRVFLLLPQP